MSHNAYGGAALPRESHASASIARNGLVTGYVFKLVRESIPMSQEALAEAIGVDRATIQGWESARRPFTAIPFGQAVALRHRLTRLGAEPSLLGSLNEAAEADYMLGEISGGASGGVLVDAHPLAFSVLTHSVVEMLSWAITGQTPVAIAARVTDRPSRRGPVSPAPTLAGTERATFFAGLRRAAELAAGDDDRSILLHRQACFLTGLDRSNAQWLNRVRSDEYFTRPLPWSRRWADARSIATALARQGDPEPLRAFISNSDDSCEIASLNYWAYWVGEVSERQHDDGFMSDGILPWRGIRLLRHLADRLTPSHAFLDLNVHTVWSLLLARKGLATEDVSTGRRLYSQAGHLLELNVGSTQTRAELQAIRYGLRMDGVTA